MEERLVLRNLKSINGQALDIIIENGRIADITEPGAGCGQQEWDGAGAFVTSGWIDMHVHAFPEFHPYGDEIDAIGVRQGVTTIVDAGSCGGDRIAELAASASTAKTRLFAFLNISRIGLQRVDELSQLEWIDKIRVQEAVLKNRSFIVGLKARISQSVVGDQGIEPLRRARELSDETGLRLMVHIGSGPPEIEEVVPLLERGDIITHYLNGKSNNLFDEEGQPLKVLQEAITRGVHLDVGHGTASFSFKIAEAAKRHGIPPDTISTDIYRGNRLNGPVYSLANVLSKFLYLGYSLEDTLAAVTTRAADWLGKPELGRIRIGEPANLTLFTVESGPAVLVDSEGEQRNTDQLIQVKGAVAHGEFIECEVRA
ncbi:amidohydrolase/deacetylase family metallohydrolase [Paenibacillus sp. NPDC058177]|uniref:amidohydrolase/deacetylase family metallohydrolase n=1 Tax=Paenibacillus sp. NPDC058177 TaxID=3346369 RepID=UPI0036DB873F